MEAGGEGVVVQVGNEDEDEGMGKEGKEIKDSKYCTLPEVSVHFLVPLLMMR